MKAKKSEVLIKESDEKFRVLLDSAGIGAWELDLVNDTAWRSLLHDQIFGYDHLLPAWGFEIFITHVIPEDREYVKQRFEEAYSKGKFSMECRIKRADDNSIRWIRAEGFAYKNEKGELAKMTGIVNDINDRKKAEENIGQLASIVEYSDDAIFCKSLDGIIKSWNKGAEKMYGYTSKEAVGKNISLVIPKEYINEEKKINERIRNNETIQHYETERIKKSGEQFYISLTISPLKDIAASITGISVIARDITERKKSEAELILANKELAFQKVEKGKRAAELGIANIELAFQDEEKGKRAEELGIANIELAFQDEEKGKRAAELGIANKELIYQDEEKEKRAAELSIANKELVFQNDEKDKRAAELSIANKELIFQNDEKEKRAAELVVANKELAFQNDEKEKRAAELGVANKELSFQNDEKEKRAAELSIANEKLIFQNDEKKNVRQS